jgi:hypothetical protein
MKRIGAIFFAFIMVLNTATVFAGEEKRGILSGIAYLEGRGFSNLLLFPAEWGHLPKPEMGGPAGYFFAGVTHTVTRVFSGITDIVALPLAYPFSKYDESIPKSFGWGEFPWQKGNHS